MNSLLFSYTKAHPHPTSSLKSSDQNRHNVHEAGNNPTNSIQKKKPKTQSLNLAKFRVKRAYVENTRDSLSLEKLGARGVVVAAQVEKLRQDLGRKGANLDRRFLGNSRNTVAADATDLSLLVFVIVATNPTWILPLPLPHNP